MSWRTSCWTATRRLPYYTALGKRLALRWANRVGLYGLLWLGWYVLLLVAFWPQIRLF